MDLLSISMEYRDIAHIQERFALNVTYDKTPKKLKENPTIFASIFQDIT